MNKDIIKPHELGDESFLCTDLEFYKIQKEKDIRKEILDENTLMTVEELEARISEELDKLGL